MTEDEQGASIDLKFNIILASGNYPPFIINLVKENHFSENNIGVTPNQFRNVFEAEAKYGKTQYSKPIFNEDIKKPIVQVEYLKPIVQNQYQDGIMRTQQYDDRAYIENQRSFTNKYSFNTTPAYKNNFNFYNSFIYNNINNQDIINDTPINKTLSFYSTNTQPNQLFNLGENYVEGHNLNHFYSSFRTPNSNIYGNKPNFNKYNQYNQYSQYQNNPQILEQGFAEVATILPTKIQNINESNKINENQEEEVQEEKANEGNREKQKDEEYEGMSDNEEVIENEDNDENTEEEQERLRREEEIEFERLYRTEEGLIIFRNGILRGIVHKYAEIDNVVEKIQIKLLKGAKFSLLYKATLHGDKSSEFHKRCDDHQMTLVLVETDKGIRFGGFTTKTWDGHCIKKIDNDAFVFSLDNNQIFDIIRNEPAIGCYPKFGPVFFGCQIRIYNDFFKKGGTTCLRGLNYKTNRDYELSKGERTYLVKDIEVYDIEGIDVE